MPFLCARQRAIAELITSLRGWNQQISAAMPAPEHLQAITALVNCYMLVACARDIFFPGTPLPLQGDEQLMLIWGSKVDKKGNVSPAAVEGVMLMIAQISGLVWATVALIKLVTVFSHQEGTFLRRNLFAVFGLMDLAFAAVFSTFEPLLQKRFGASVTPYVALFVVEGVAFLQDALMRPRKVRAA